MATTPSKHARPKTRADDARGAPKGAGTVTPAHGGRIGNPPFVPTDEQRSRVRTLAQTHPEHSNHRIAIQLGISRATLERHFRDDIDLGRAQMISAIGAQMIQRALRGNDALGADGNPLCPGDLDAQKFILARLGGWSTKIEHTGKDGGPIATVDLSNLSDEELEAYGRLSAIAEGVDPEEVIGPDA